MIDKNPHYLQKKKGDYMPENRTIAEQNLRHFCAAQFGCFDEMLQIEEIDI